MAFNRSLGNWLSRNLGMHGKSEKWKSNFSCEIDETLKFFEITRMQQNDLWVFISISWLIAIIIFWICVLFDWNKKKKQ